MKNKGFTLVEVIAVIAIISALTILAITTNMNVKKNAATKAYNEKINSIEIAAALWGQDNVTLFSLMNCNDGTSTYKPQNASVTSYTCYTELKVQNLIDAKYIDPDTSEGNISDPRDKTKTLNNSRVIVFYYFNNYYAEYYG